MIQTLETKDFEYDERNKQKLLQLHFNKLVKSLWELYECLIRSPQSSSVCKHSSEKQSKTLVLGSRCWGVRKDDRHKNSSVY